MLQEAMARAVAAEDGLASVKLEEQQTEAQRVECRRAVEAAEVKSREIKVLRARIEELEEECQVCVCGRGSSGWHP